MGKSTIRGARISLNISYIQAVCKVKAASKVCSNQFAKDCNHITPDREQQQNSQQSPTSSTTFEAPCPLPSNSEVHSRTPSKSFWEALPSDSKVPVSEASTAVRQAIHAFTTWCLLHPELATCAEQPPEDMQLQLQRLGRLLETLTGLPAETASQALWKHVLGLITDRSDRCSSDVASKSVLQINVHRRTPGLYACAGC